MGHSSIQVTFDTYGHLFPSPQDDREVMRQIQARLLPGGHKEGTQGSQTQPKAM